MLYGAVETGGTKIICTKLDESGQVLDSIRFLTETPDLAVEKIVEFYGTSGIVSLGIGSFGPIDLNPQSSTYGCILDTPKQHWRFYPFLQKIQEKLAIPVALDTDVNCACLGEATYGAAKGLGVAVYVTIGTGIGVGVCINGITLKGMLHPEAGHILIRKNPKDSFDGICAYHGNCFEGLASGPAIQARAGRAAYEIPLSDPVWEIEADYIGQALMNYVLAYSPERIVLGGGVMEQMHLFPMIRERAASYLNGYLKTSQLRNMDSYIVPSALGGKQAILGAFCLAKKISHGETYGNN